jgi:glycosyltransferase involved in cell wall biosynthesis
VYLIVGDGPERKRLEYVVEGYGMEENIIFL